MPRPEEFRRKLQTLATGGPANLCVISDFDQTISKFYANGQLGHSTFKILELSGLFTPEFQEEMLRLYHYYHPIERNPDMPAAEKSAHMDSWWLLTYERYLTLDINKSQLLEMIKRANIQLRHGIDDLMNTCRKHRVPIKVISAGLGNFIDLLLTSAVGFDEADIVSNFMLFDENGRICGFSEPLIHSLKKSVALQDRQLAPNLLVLGDIPTDTDVIRDIKFEESLCVGFANDVSKIPLADFTERYDLLIFDDGDLDVVDEVVKVVAGEASLDALLQRLTS